MTPSKRTRTRPLLTANPILVKELRSRMRGMRAFAILTGVLLLLAGVSYLFYRIVLATTIYSNMPISPQIGQSLLVGLAVVELMMVCFIAPAVTASAISSEKERLTYEMLLATPLRPASILWGKLISALGYVFLLILAGVPMSSLVFTFGGVTVLDMVKISILLTAIAVTLGVVGVTLSAWLERTVRATVFSYLVVLGLLFGPFLVYIMVGVIRQSLPPPWILIPNPLSALFSALPLASGGNSPAGVVGELGRVLSGGMAMGGGMGMPQDLARPLYHYTLALYATISLGLYLLATRLVRPTRRWRIHWREVGIALGLFLALAASVVAFFGVTADRYDGGVLRPAPTPAPFRVEGPVAPVEVSVERAVPVQVVPVLPPTPAPTPPEPSALSAGNAPVPDLAGLYATAIRQLYVSDRGRAARVKLEVLTIGHAAGDSAVSNAADASSPVPIPVEVQKGVVEALADLGPAVEWVDGPAVLTLSDAGVNEDGIGQVALLFEPTPDISIIRMYLLERVDGTWRILGGF
jgi:ABC-2 type transport system permease protein